MTTYISDPNNPTLSFDSPSGALGPVARPDMISPTRELPNEGEALAISEALDRDRAVDESGNQISVFGRVGARPLNRDEQQQMYLRDGQVWRVSDNPADYRNGYRAPSK